MSSLVAVEASKFISCDKGGTVKGVPCAWPKCFLFYSSKAFSFSWGQSKVFHSVHSFGETLGSCGTSIVENPSDRLAPRVLAHLLEHSGHGFTMLLVASNIVLRTPLLDLHMLLLFRLILVIMGRSLVFQSLQGL